MSKLKTVTLEMSLKPFRSTGQKDIENVCEKLFEQWKPLLKHADSAAVLLWTSDGSEILEYKGDMDEELEWAKYIGGANPRQDWDKVNDPKGEGLHTRYYLYTSEPPVFTYADLKRIVSCIRRVGRAILGIPVLVGETFDPGPEFAKSDFKYNRHNEICVGESMGRSSMVCCYGILNADDCRYAAFPDGIPQGMPFGTFLGKQAQRFLSDMGFDYLWLSNGFGFGTETWGITGAIFDGERFIPEKIEETQARILEFWKFFRKECSYPVQTRGTNLTVGIDLATDAVSHLKLYNGGFDILPPPNSPWAAINGDFGLELAGYMSRMAELPAEDYLYRFYLHDPWWMNSPWADRYEGYAHDIFLPLATARIDKNGSVQMPRHINILTVDNSLGEIPAQCALEVIPHLLKSLEIKPDSPSPFVLIYPFQEYSGLKAGRIGKPFFEDWFLIDVINSGLPVNTVISTENFARLYQNDPQFLKSSVLVTPVPDHKSSMNDALMSFVSAGGKVMLYGSVKNADPGLLQFMGLKTGKEVTGNVAVETVLPRKIEYDIKPDRRLSYTGELSDGGLHAVARENCGLSVLTWALQKQEKRVLLSQTARREWSGGALIWCRGSGCTRIENRKSTSLLAIDFLNSAELYGYEFHYFRKNKSSESPVLSIHKNKSSLWVSGYVPDTTTEICLRTPLGVPLLFGNETEIKHDCAAYRMPRAWRCECRVFVEKTDSVQLSCREIAPVSYTGRRRFQVDGLINAVVYILINEGNDKHTEVLLNSKYPFCIGETFTYELTDTIYGRAIRAENISGTITVSDHIR